MGKFMIASIVGLAAVVGQAQAFEISAPGQLAGIAAAGKAGLAPAPGGSSGSSSAPAPKPAPSSAAGDGSVRQGRRTIGNPCWLPSPVTNNPAPPAAPANPNNNQGN